MDILRTPDERFSALPGYRFAPHYVDDLPGYAGLRIHYIDEGPRDGPVFLCLHGQPSWSYLYRHMIPVFARTGRVIAPDLPGFGRSDKPVDDAVYSFDFHRELLLRFVERLDLTDIALVCQDWGGLLGLTLPMVEPRRWTRLLVMNTALGTGDVRMTAGFMAWREWSATQPDMAVGRLFQRSCPQLSPAECAAYDAPFPGLRYKAGVRRFPQLVPTRPTDPGAALSRQARDWWRRDWTGSAFMAIGMQDPVLGPEVMRGLRRQIRGCGEPFEVAQAGHFVQEWGQPIANKALEYWRLTF